MRLIDYHDRRAGFEEYLHLALLLCFEDLPRILDVTKLILNSNYPQKQGKTAIWLGTLQYCSHAAHRQLRRHGSDGLAG